MRLSANYVCDRFQSLNRTLTISFLNRVVVLKTVILHRLCHRQIHALLTENQLARQYSTIEALKGHSEIAKFIEWISKKPTHIRASIKRSREKGYL